ncbi:hypothetical protein EYF80_056893 [Liparis tanakae]|uniref:Uncharacterized protein n=1 Tax=Liparis tanakae TaxID=230148 RepID=A0A4Z2EVX5_9TELE|nr:hypothetical protein EYF80_056893 [Liparis tanakae]
MVSNLDYQENDDQDLQGVEEVDPGLVCARQECMAGRAELMAMQANMEKKERESLLLLKKIKVQARKLRRLTKVVREMREDAACSRGVERVVVVERVVQPVEEQEERVEEQVEEQDERVDEREEQGERVEEVNNKLRAVFKGTGRGAALRHLALPPSIDQFLESYQSYQEGSNPSQKQLENAKSKASRVRSFLYYLSVGKSDLASWLFLDDAPRIQKYASQLMGEMKEITTIMFYFHNIIQFMDYLQETPPRTCRLRRSQILGITRSVKRAMKQLGRSLVTHQLKVKAKKMKNLISRFSLRRYQEQARLAIPELLTRMEADYSLRDTFYGHFSAFVVSIYGHRPGVFTNMTVPEVEAARSGPRLHTDTGYVITIDEHKTNREFGGAQIFLTFEEFSWLERWLEAEEMRRKFEEVTAASSSSSLPASSHDPTPRHLTEARSGDSASSSERPSNKRLRPPTPDELNDDQQVMPKKLTKRLVVVLTPLQIREKKKKSPVQWAKAILHVNEESLLSLACGQPGGGAAGGGGSQHVERLPYLAPLMPIQHQGIEPVSRFCAVAHEMCQPVPISHGVEVLGLETVQETERTCESVNKCALNLYYVSVD